MKTIFHGLVIALVSMTPAWAETCEESFDRLLRGSQETETPTRNRSVTEMKNGMRMVSEHLRVAEDHYMTAMREPPGPWSMVYGDTMYTSMDEGKTWTVLRKIEDAGAQDHLDALAQTVTNAACSESELDGVIYDTVEADYRMDGDSPTDIHNKFWVSRADGFIPKSETAMKNAAFETFVTQSIERVPDLTLPVPE